MKNVNSILDHSCLEVPACFEEKREHMERSMEKWSGRRSKKKKKKATQRKQKINSRDKGIVVDKKKKELAKTKMRTHIYNAPSLWQSAWLFFPS